MPIAREMLFLIQMIMAWFYAIPQAKNIMQGKVDGLNLTLYVVLIAYILFSLSLSYASYNRKSTRVRKQTIIVFVQWLILIGFILIVSIKQIAWTRGDTFVTIGIAITSIATIRYFKDFNHPYFKGFMAMWCKAIPQLWIVCTIIFDMSGTGLPLMTIVAGHITAFSRIALIIFGGVQSGWDKPTKGLMIGETSNIISWITVTIAWLIY